MCAIGSWNLVLKMTDRIRVTAAHWKAGGGLEPASPSAFGQELNPGVSDALNSAPPMQVLRNLL